MQTGFALKDPGCLARLSRRIASKVPYVGLGDAGDKTQRPFFKGPHAHDSVLNLAQRIDGLEKTPVIVVAVFKDLFNDVAPVFFGIQRRSVRIPEQVLWKFAEIDIRWTHSYNIVICMRKRKLVDVREVASLRCFFNESKILWNSLELYSAMLYPNAAYPFLRLANIRMSTGTSVSA